MSRYIKPTQEFGGSDDLLKWSKETKNAKQIRRYLAIRALMCGEEAFKSVAETFGVTVRTLELWIQKWNKGGKEAIKIIPQTGRPPKFTNEHAKRVEALINNQHKSEEGKTRLTIKGVYGFLKGRISN